METTRKDKIAMVGPEEGQEEGNGEEEAEGQDGGQGQPQDPDEEDEEEEDVAKADTMVDVQQTHIIAAESTAPSIAFFDPTTRLDMRTEEGLQFQMTPLVDLGEQQIQEPVTEVNGDAKSVSEGGSRLRVHASSADMLLVCEWDQCRQEFGEVKDFLKHVSGHVTDVRIKYRVGGGGNSNGADEKDPDDPGVISAEEEADGEDRFACLWQSCGHESPSSSEMVRHINFHAFHTKIKRLGENVLRRSGLAPCLFSEDQRNVIPDLGEPFRCLWRGCEEEGQEWLEAQKYYWHVQWHAEELRGECPPAKKRRKGDQDNVGGKVKLEIPCRWQGCNHVAGELSKLKNHLRSHSQERMYGCPVCGGLFANSTKFVDHCKRQDASCKWVRISLEHFPYKIVLLC